MTEFTLIKKSLSAERLKQWYDKLQIYHFFEPHYMRVGDEMSCWDTFDSKPRNISVDEYNSRDKSIPLVTSYHVLEKTNDMECAYMWDKIAKKELDATDHKFEVNPSYLPRVDLYGLHSYGGYHGFFRPDLSEVIHLIDQSTNPLLAFDRVSRIYVTTDTYPSDNVNDCYDSKAGRHRARTVCYVVPC